MSEVVTGRQIVAHRDEVLTEMLAEVRTAQSAVRRGVFAALSDAMCGMYPKAPPGWVDWYANGDELH